MAHLELTDIHKWYGDGESRHHAVRGFSGGLERGEFVAMRGPSGCGKSTLLHIAGAMDQPTSGMVSLAGERFDEFSPEQLAVVRRRRVGFVFQAFNLMPTLTAVENVALPRLLDGERDADATDRAQQALGEVGLADKTANYPSQLSGGEMQRVAIARAVAIEPDLLVADEPTGALDSENGQRVLELLTRLNEERGLTILMATHSDDAARFAARCWRLRDGQLETAADADPSVGAGGDAHDGASAPDAAPAAL